MLAFLAFSKVAPAFQKQGEVTAPHRCFRLKHGKQGAGIVAFQPKRMWKHWQREKQRGRTDTHSFQKTATNNPFLICVGLPWTDQSRIPRYSVSTLVKTKRKLTNSWGVIPPAPEIPFPLSVSFWMSLCLLETPTYNIMRGFTIQTLKKPSNCLGVCSTTPT